MTKITIMTNEGKVIIPGQEVLPGLFLHKKLLGNGELTTQLKYSLTVSTGIALYKEIRAPKGKIIQWVKENLSGFNWETASRLSPKDKARLIELKNRAPFSVSF